MWTDVKLYSGMLQPGQSQGNLTRSVVMLGGARDGGDHRGLRKALGSFCRVFGVKEVGLERGSWGRVYTRLLEASHK